MRPSVVICGSYHLDLAGLKRLFRELDATGCRIISPISVNFTDNSEPVVRAAYENDFNVDELERFHLRALSSADLVFLHAPGGHVGISASYELGFASALNKPVFSMQNLSDEMLATRVKTVTSVFSALEFSQHRPASSASV